MVSEKIGSELYLWQCFTYCCLCHLAEGSRCVISKLHILVNFGPDFLGNIFGLHLDIYIFVIRAILAF